MGVKYFMTLTRIVPVLLIKNGKLIRSSNFSDHRVVGDPFLQCRRFNSWDIDEIVYLNITPTYSETHSIRSDLKNPPLIEIGEIQKFVAEVCQVPLAWGGNLRSESDAGRAIEVFGADKVIFTTALDSNPDAVFQTSRRFGSQAVCAGIDYRTSNGSIEVFVQSGAKKVSEDFETWIQKAEDFGAGEILLHSIDRDGMRCGLDIETLIRAKAVTKVPIVLLGGAGKPGHLAEGARKGASGVAASNLWHFSDNVSNEIRNEFKAMQISVRNP
jgi:cyclase